MNRVYFVLTPFFFFLAIDLMAQVPDDLYLEDLRDWLKSETYEGDFNNLGYSEARRQMFSYTDEVNGQIQCIYTDFLQVSVYSTFPEPMNTEHLIPQSLFGSAEPMRSDIHVIRPSHQSVNSARANYPFGEVDDSEARWHGVDGTGEYFGTFEQPVPDQDYSEGLIGLFEPQEDRKGDVARQVFYFYTMYPDQAGSINSVADIELLYSWHLQDPVDALELQRNDRVEVAQGNRNPYIDYADLAYRAWLWEPDACDLFSTAPVDLSKSFRPVPFPHGDIDRVQVKWYKESPKVKYAPEDSAACDIQFWPVKDLALNQFVTDPDTTLLSKRKKPGQFFFKWPLFFSRAEIFPNFRFKFRIRCYCNQGEGPVSPWSEVKFFNTPAYDPMTNIYLPPEIQTEDLESKNLGLLDYHNEIEFYPNPSRGLIYLSTRTTQSKSIQIMNMTGQEVMTLTISDKEDKKIDLSSLPKGVYLMRIGDQLMGSLLLLQ